MKKLVALLLPFLFVFITGCSINTSKVLDSSTIELQSESETQQESNGLIYSEVGLSAAYSSIMCVEKYYDGEFSKADTALMILEVSKDFDEYLNGDNVIYQYNYADEVELYDDIITLSTFFSNPYGLDEDELKEHLNKLKEKTNYDIASAKLEK